MDENGCVYRRIDSRGGGRRSVGERRGKGGGRREKREGKWNVGGVTGPSRRCHFSSHVQLPLYGGFSLRQTTVGFRVQHETLSPA